MEVRYPNVHVRIVGEYPSAAHLLGDPEAYSVESPEAKSILDRVRRALKEGGASDEAIEEYTKEATSRCFNHLLFTTATWVQLHRMVPRYTTP